MWAFDSWSHGRPATHRLVTPATDTTYTAKLNDFDCANGVGTAIFVLGLARAPYLRTRRRLRAP